MKSIILALLVLAAGAASAEQGLAVEFVVEDVVSSGGSGERHSYESSFLFAFGEAAAASIGDRIHLEFSAKDGGEAADLTVALFSLDAGQKQHIGTYTGTVAYGGNATESWPAGVGRTFSLTLSPTRKALPGVGGR